MNYLKKEIKEHLLSVPLGFASSFSRHQFCISDINLCQRFHVHKVSIADLLHLLLIAIDIVAIMSTLNCCCFFRFVSCVHFFCRKAPSLATGPYSSPGWEGVRRRAGRSRAGRRILVGSLGFQG